MACNCDLLKTEVMSQRELMAEWFQTLMEEIRDARAELVELIKANTFNVGNQPKTIDQQLIGQQTSVAEPMSASEFLESINSPLQCSDVASDSNPVLQSLELPRNPEIEHAPDPSFINDLISPKIEPKAEELSLELRSAQKEHSYVTLGDQAKATSEINPFCDVESAKLNAIDKNEQFEPELIEKPFACNQCEGRFTTKSSLIRHKRCHTGEKPFGCSLCPKKFKQKHHLTGHIMVHHTGEKDFKCDLCGYSCRRKSNLVKHKRFHTGEKRSFPCDQCSFSADYNYELIVHQTVHTGEKPFACDQCDFRTSRKLTLQNHQRIHSGEKPFQCDLCDYRAVSQCTIAHHKRRRHQPQP